MGRGCYDRGGSWNRSPYRGAPGFRASNSRIASEEEAIGRSEWYDLGGVGVRLPQVEDLLIMKAIAQRPQDLRDIEGLLDVHPGANVAFVRQWVREFTTAMAMPDLLEGFEQLLNQRNSRLRK